MSPAWQTIATFLIRKRIAILIVLGLLTAMMWYVRGTKFSNELTKVVPQGDPELVAYENFRKEFGDDASTIIIALDGDFWDLEVYNGLYDMTQSIREVYGVQNIFGITALYHFEPLMEEEQFDVIHLPEKRPETQAELDSLALLIQSLPFYRGLLLDESGETALLAISVVPEILNSERKVKLYEEIEAQGNIFEEKHGVQLRYAGLPVLRVNTTKLVQKELTQFLYYALIVTAITLLIFFRSIYMVIFPMLVVVSVIIWSMGIIGIFGYEITLVTGVVPALITVISIPNSVYLITKYHIEYRRTQNKMKSLILVIEKIGIVTIMTNATTAVGLGVLAVTDIIPLKEFGVVAGLSVVVSFFISLMLIPIVFSFLPPPTKSQTRHLDRKTLTFGIRALDKIVHNYRWAVYAGSILIAGFSAWGVTQVRSEAFIADDVPKDSQVMRDLKYVEDSFNGALPFEIVIDTRKKNGLRKYSNLRKIDELQERLKKYTNISRTMSITDMARFSRQAFFGGKPDQYLFPTRYEFSNVIGPFLQNTIRKEYLGPETFSKQLTDSLRQKVRISGSVRDIGSLEMKSLIDSVQVDVDSVFGTDTTKFITGITGTTQIFIRGNEYLVDNLLNSLAVAFVVIAFIMGLLFRSIRMIIISLVPNFLPLLMVAGAMGFLGVALKPSTALVFGVAFGIAVDDSIHFLARYRLARSLGDSVSHAVSNSFLDTGVSMIYTSIILFFGFVIFTFSSYGGTQALGLLTSMTLAIAMFSNLLLLPALLITFDTRGKVNPEDVPDAELAARS